MTSQLELGQPEVEVKKPAEDDLSLWSVTSILATLDRVGLNIWNVNETARAAIRMLKSIPARLEEQGEDAVVKQIAAARFDRPADAISDSAFGTAMHGLLESYALTGMRPDIDDTVFKREAPKADACLDRWDEWLNDFHPEFLGTECAVYSPRYGYAGTLDALLKLDGVPLVCDYKTSMKDDPRVFSEVALQLAAYRHAEFAAVWRPRIHERYRRRYYQLSPAEQAMAVPLPELEGGIAIKVTPSSCTAYPVVCDNGVWRAFLVLCEVARFQNNDAAYVIGEPLVPSERAS